MKRIIVCLLCLLAIQATWAFDQQKDFEKIYKTLSLAGDEMPSGQNDIPDLDEGHTDLVRQLINLNELTTDVVYSFWGDPGLPELASAKPESDNSWVLGMYRRLEFNILKCNEFLDNATDSDEETKVQRAEVRFLRAYFYSLAIDLWGDMPLWKTASDQSETRSSRKEVFDFIKQELTSCADDMALPGASQYGKADRVAAWLLLARLYLNAEVYTGTPQWQLAKDFAQKVIDSDYALCDHYSYLFMGDNHSNGAQSEIILPALVDGLTQYSYGNTMFLIAATHSFDMPSCGISQYWAGYYARYDLLTKFFPKESIPNSSTAESAAAAGDDRCLLYGIDRLQGQQLNNNFTNGFSIDKFTNNCAYGTASSNNFPDTDFPLLRIAEAYLCYAEADARQHSGSCTDDGLEKLNALRQRAHAVVLGEATLSDLADEWCREFYLEGRRRSDLIRFGLYTGDDYLWTGKGGNDYGQALKSYRSLMPMPDEVLIEHLQFTQNAGYYDPNFVPDELVLNTPAFGSDIVDLSLVRALRLNWQRPSNLPENGKAGISIELSLNPEFSTPKLTLQPDDDAYELLVDAQELNSFLQSNNSQAYQYTSVCVYARCLTRNAVSNTVVLNVKAYDNTYEQMPQPWYFIGNCIGKVEWNNSVSGLGTSMFPTNINADGSSVFTGYFREGDSFVLVNTPGSWESVVRSYDGSPYNLSISESGDNINIFETGWYTFHVYPQWSSAYSEMVSDQGWPLYESMTMASGFRGSVITEMQSCNLGNPNNHVWYARMTFDADDNLSFLPAGNYSAKVGGTGFPFGNATDASQTIPVKAGNYVVFFDDMTGSYQFTDADTGLLPKLFERGHLTAEVTPEALIHLTEIDGETVKLCDISLPAGTEMSTLRLTIGKQEFSLNAQGEVNASEFVDAMIVLFGQYGQHTVEAQVSFTAMVNDLVSEYKSEPFTLTIQLLSMSVEEHYYYIGGLTYWDFNRTMPMTCLSGDQWIIDPRFQIIIPVAANTDEYFCIFPESALDSDDPWSTVIRPAGVVEPPSEDSFGVTDFYGSWHIPLADHDTTYQLTLDFNQGTYTFSEIENIATAIPQSVYDVSPMRQQVFNLQGCRIGDLVPSHPRTLAPSIKKGIYIINHKKVIIK